MAHSDPVRSKQYHREYYVLNRNERIAYAKTREISRKELLTALKMDVGCADCGYKANAVALEFHHIDPSTKVRALSNMLHSSMKKIQEEIDKCIVLCANCHAIRERS